VPNFLKDFYNGKNTLVYNWLVGLVLIGWLLNATFGFFINIIHSASIANPLAISNGLIIDCLIYLTYIYYTFICISIIKTVQKREMKGFWKYFNLILATLMLLTSLSQILQYIDNQTYYDRIWDSIELSVNDAQGKMPIKTDSLTYLTNFEASKIDKSVTCIFKVSYKSIPKEISESNISMMGSLCNHKKYQQMLKSVVKTINLKYVAQDGSSSLLSLTRPKCKL
jgi:hypothetical protein